MRLSTLSAVAMLANVPGIAPAQPVTSIAASDQPMLAQTAEAQLLALERTAQQPLADVIAEFESGRFAPTYQAATTPEERRALLEQIRTAAAQAGGVGIDQEDDGYVMTFDGPATYLVRVTLAKIAPFGITALSIDRMAEATAIQLETLESEIDSLMAEGGRSGVVYVAIDGKVALEKAYGMANADLGTANTIDTVFGIGSRPIDFTVAAIYLLEQRGKLGLDDRLDQYFPDAPADRAGMTLRQMMTGKSGLPDFPVNDSDWDADLGWIDRAEFERRTMATPLLFEPGNGDAHSHWAFGVLAAIVERVSGQGYYPFLRENFFDPAGMARTGNYGESRGLKLTDFAAGGGKQVGVPNIPPNWGPTSWLVMGSGGMFSTLGDLRLFYSHVTRGGVLEQRYIEHFLTPSANLDGSDRGFELFSFTDENRSDEVYVFLNNGGQEAMRPLVRPLVQLLKAN
ncbi:MAG: serine hydrolase domain-containing protein [Parasphingorhabdus sp.]